MEEDEQGQGHLNNGVDSILQALAIMRDKDEFDRKYGEIPQNLKCGREASISALVDLVERMKRQLESKAKVADKLKAISVWWQELVDDRQKMRIRIKDLDQGKTELEKEVTRLKSELAKINRTNSVTRRLISVSASSDSSVISIDNSQSEKDVDIVLPSDEDEDNAGEEDERDGDISKNLFGKNPNPSTGRQSNLPTNTNRVTATSSTRYEFNIESQENQMGKTNDNNNNTYGIRTDQFSQSQRADLTHPLLTCNPYSNIDLSYYNPTQYFQRLSTASGVRRRGKGRGGGAATTGGRKKSTPAKSKANSTEPGPGEPSVKKYKQCLLEFPRRKPRKQKIVEQLEKEAEAEELRDESAIEVDEEATSYFPKENNDRQGQANPDMPKPSTSDPPSPEQGFFDYTAAFLDETN